METQKRPLEYDSETTDSEDDEPVAKRVALPETVTEPQPALPETIQQSTSQLELIDPLPSSSISAVFDDFSRILMERDLECALQILTPGISQERINDFRERNSMDQIEAILPSIIATAKLKERESNNPMIWLKHGLTVLVDSLRDFMEPELYEEVLRTWNETKGLLDADTGYTQRFLIKVKSMSHEEINNLIISSNGSATIQRVLMTLAPTMIRLLSSTIKTSRV